MDVSTIRDVPLFAEVSADALDRIGRHGVLRSYPAGAVV